jgi:hypothetical protein
MPNHDFRQKPQRPRLILLTEQTKSASGRIPEPAPGLDLERAAQILGGEARGGRVLAPGPERSAADRSLVVEINQTAPSGFTSFSYRAADFAVRRELVRQQLGLPLLPRPPRLRAIAGGRR